MSPWVISLFLAIGVSAWLYPKLNSRSGYTMSGQSALVVGVIGLLIFVIGGITLQMLLP
jgi:hypothetical protein